MVLVRHSHVYVQPCSPSKHQYHQVGNMYSVIICVFLCRSRIKLAHQTHYVGDLRYFSAWNCTCSLLLICTTFLLSCSPELLMLSRLTRINWNHWTDSLVSESCGDAKISCNVWLCAWSRSATSLCNIYTVILHSHTSYYIYFPSVP